MPNLNLSDLTPIAWLVFLFASFLIGMAKTGVHGVGMMAIPVLALVFGGKASAGLMLPTLILADVLAVLYYRRYANWPILWKLFPWAALGVLMGTWLGALIDDDAFRILMGIIIFVSLGVMVWLEKTNTERIPHYGWFTVLAGVLGGFTTMVGNLAGPVMAVYLLSARLPKNEYIGTSAWFFLFVNVFKVPFHILFWGTISPSSFVLNLAGLPLIVLGALAGIWVVKLLAEQNYRWFIIVTTALAALLMVF